MDELQGSRPPSLARRLGVRLQRRRFRALVVGLACGYLGILAFPDLLFARQMTHGNFRVASDAPIDPGLTRVLDRATIKLGTSSINEPAMIHRIYLCKSWWRKALLAPTNLGAYGITRGFFEYTVLLGEIDVDADRIVRDPPRLVGRSLSGVIAHERTHALIDGRLGLWASMRCPSWKKEGYCDYVAGDTTFPIPEAIRLIRAGQESHEPAFRYARSYLLVKYLIEIEKWSVAALMDAKVEESELLEKVRSQLDRLAPAAIK
ncbi:hypothetical protein Sinac_1166 [Singulisphaera acidiphila DSM 18658]|uniref:Peptidase MA-like domain-containing protein n=1 Tax=Singulisphaera acidiphila (strain ATCC BAA-1392 / DSM 18658 / VKM B-2454 / MOB10) TaxID=886293 RepID=L0D8K3_SINAD|nr:hypothetical protein Sinac_1166 [Singulisphaera acidiphila DSM 18658]